jgi:hypothetical protein
VVTLAVAAMGVAWLEEAFAFVLQAIGNVPRCAAEIFPSERSDGRRRPIVFRHLFPRAAVGGRPCSGTLRQYVEATRGRQYRVQVRT